MTTEQQKEKWETEFVTPSHSDTPFRGGKVTMQLAWFYSQCKKKNKVILSMPEGEIYSPEALKSLLERQRENGCPPHNMIDYDYVGGWSSSIPPPNKKCTKCLLEVRF